MQDVFRDQGFPSKDVDCETLADGAIILRSPLPLGDYEERLGDYLYRWASHRPDQVFLAEKSEAGAWDRLTYSAALQCIENIAQALLDRGLGVGDTLVILSPNSTKQALLTLACMHIGVVVVPVSPALDSLSVDNGEITDKGYINQRAVLAHRAELINEMYSSGEGVILPTNVCPSIR